MAHKDLIDALIEDHGTLFSEEIGANIARDVPQQWFHWLECAVLMSARISAANAVQAARALKDEGLTKPEALRAANRQHLVAVLNRNGYARYDSQGADYLRAAADLVGERHGDDLRKLRDEAGSGEGIREALTGFKGIGQTGAGIFAREAQIAWDALYPTVDGPEVDQAGKLGLPDDAQELADAAGSRERFTRLAAALTRVALHGPSDRVKEAAE
ncbi:MAG TPA: hypothetical protein DEA05_07985 [Rhodobacteraceae bacterium]|nr:hypothetical protein [Paracoccaceae bacterium]